MRASWTPSHFIGAAALGTIGVFATRDAWLDILRVATTDEESSHILLVPIVAAWMAWIRRIRLRFCPPTGTWIGPPIALAGWAMSAWGYYGEVLAAWHAGAIAMVVGCILSVVGKNVLFRFMPSFVVLAFMVPVPGGLRQQVAVPLQTATAAVTQGIFEILGVAVQRSGNLLIINNVDVTVAEACNGMRMVFALILVSYAFAFSMPLRNSVRALVLLASPLAAIVCNVFRLLPTIWMYGYGSHTIAEGFHDLSGWLMLPVAFLLLLGIIRLLRWALIPVARYTLAYQ